MTTDQPTAPLVFLDTETTGLTPEDEIWEFAAILHDLERAAALPDSFRADHDARYHLDDALGIDLFADLLANLFPGRGDYSGRPHIVGCGPDFDTTRLARIMRHHGYGPGWHHHLIDAETLAVGWLRGRRQALIAAGSILPDSPAFPPPPWDSEALSRAVGIDPDRFERHTAMGDVRWAMAIYDAVMGSDR
jgi:hypothetical protein